MFDNLYRWILKSFRLHQAIFLVGIGGLLAIDFFFLEKWATFWGMLGWAMIFGVHYLIFRSHTVDEEWLEEKMLFNVYRLWDYGHTGEIKRNPFGKSIYRTETGKIENLDKVESTKSMSPAKNKKD